MNLFDLNHRRRMLDEDCYVLAVIVGLADPHEALLDELPSCGLTPQQARVLAACADRHASIVRMSDQGLWATRLSSRIAIQAQHVRDSADALDRAMRATSDDASTAADGASLVVSA